MLSRYGPEGVRLMVAGCADVLSVFPVMIAAVVLRTAFRQSAAVVVSVILLAVGLGGVALALVRLAQASGAVKRYRKHSLFKE
jgi:ABC-type dipeptide/oligopeptide/nickel transport system permease subunit